MASAEIDCSVDSTSLIEGVATLARWAARVEHLPRHLRAEIVAISKDEDSLAVGELVGSEIVISPSPRLLVLLANLRAQEA